MNKTLEIGNHPECLVKSLKECFRCHLVASIMNVLNSTLPQLARKIVFKTLMRAFGLFGFENVSQ